MPGFLLSTVTGLCARGLGFGQTDPTVIYEDDRVVILTTEAEYSAGGSLKHIDVKFRFATESVRN
jgi:hypothetical protein